MKITVLGVGYVGLVTGTCFSETGVDVMCVDIDPDKIDKLRQGIIPIYEPGLPKMLQNNIDKGRLKFTTKIKEGIKGSEAVFICVGTPSDEDGSADLKYVLEVARQIGQEINKYMVVVTKSTVPVGTSEKVRAVIKEELEKRKSDIQFDVASNPEFLKEGDAVEDFLRPDRIVIGTDSPEAENTLKRLYKPFLLNQHPILYMDIPSAEMTKYAANAMLATKISFMNDLANLCEKIGADINYVRNGIGSDPRIGNKFIYPGTGYGGSCFPKDVKALINTGKINQYNLEILQAVDAVNDKQKKVLIKKIMEHFNNDINGKTFGIWGLSFKPHTDDTRESPAIVIINELLEKGAKVKAYDPVAINESRKLFNDKIVYGKDQYDVLIDADAMILVTEWEEFRMPNFPVLNRLMKNKLIFDGRNIYDSEEMEEEGFTYYCIGRKKVG